MDLHVIGYDLNKPGQDYEDLYDAIKSYTNWWHHLDSTWIVKTNDSVSDVRDDLKQHVDSGDDLLVMKLSGVWASKGLSNGTDWLYDNL